MVNRTQPRLCQQPVPTARETSVVRTVALAAALMSASVIGIRGDDGRARIGRHNWGTVVAPVYGSVQEGTYAGAELFAAPNQFDGDYYHGVLPQRADRAARRRKRSGRDESARSQAHARRQIPDYE